MQLHLKVTPLFKVLQHGPWILEGIQRVKDSILDSAVVVDAVVQDPEMIRVKGGEAFIDR